MTNDKMIAIITGAAGQDGSYLSEYLLSLDYHVVGITRRRSAEPHFYNLKNSLLNSNFTLIEGDINDSTFLSSVIYKYRPNEFYNLAAQSNVGHSFKEPIFTFETDALSVIKQLDILRLLSPYTKYYQASTSEIWGGLNCPEDGYSEDSIVNPRSPYAIAKSAAYYTIKNYRESYGIFCSNGILFNHSSERRGHDFATRKITQGIANFIKTKQKIKMGDLSAYRDEGYAPEYVQVMHKILQHDSPDDFIIATEETASIKQMLEYACASYQLDFNDVYELDERFIRPSEVPFLKGNISKAKSKLNWTPKFLWRDVLDKMLEYDVKE